MLWARNRMPSDTRSKSTPHWAEVGEEVDEFMSGLLDRVRIALTKARGTYFMPSGKLNCDFAKGRCKNAKAARGYRCR
jgi:hypothetical protein